MVYTSYIHIVYIVTKQIQLIVININSVYVYLSKHIEMIAFFK
jgi:hypothetical protein